MEGARIRGCEISAERRRRRAVAERELRGGWRVGFEFEFEFEELVRIGVRKEGEGVGRPESVRAVESWAGVMAIL